MIEKGSAVINKHNNKIGLFWPKDNINFMSDTIIYYSGGHEDVSINDLIEFKFNVGDSVHTVKDMHRITVNGIIICGGYNYNNWQRYEDRDAVITGILYNSSERLSYKLSICSQYYFSSLFFDLSDFDNINNNNTKDDDNLSNNILLNNIYKALGKNV